MEKKNWLTLKTKAGCWHLFLILVAAILVFSFCAQMITTRGGHIKVQKMTIDARGAKLEGDLYYPAGISDEDKLPAVIVVHGGGVNKGHPTEEEITIRAWKDTIPSAPPAASWTRLSSLGRCSLWIRRGLVLPATPWAP